MFIHSTPNKMDTYLSCSLSLPSSRLSCEVGSMNHMGGEPGKSLADGMIDLYHFCLLLVRSTGGIFMASCVKS